MERVRNTNCYWKGGVIVPDKKEQPKNGEKQEEGFTGSPEQQLPDLESEDKKDRQEKHPKKESQSDKQKEK